MIEGISYHFIYTDEYGATLLEVYAPDRETADATFHEVTKNSFNELKIEPWPPEWNRFCRKYMIAAMRISFWYWKIRLKYGLLFKYPGPKVTMK